MCFSEVVLLNMKFYYWSKFSQVTGRCLYVCLSVHTCVCVCPLTGTYLFISPFRHCRPVQWTVWKRSLPVDLSNAPFAYLCSASICLCGLFSGGISSENQCCHGWMYVAPTSARVRSPTHSSHMGPIYMSPAGRGFPAGPSIFVNFKYTNTFLSMPLQSGLARHPARWSSSLPVSIYSPGPDRLFVYESVRPDKTESHKVMNTNFANQFYLKYKI